MPILSKRYKINAIILTLTIFLLIIRQNTYGKEINFIAYGDIRGYLEPCGCDPETDLGGIVRIGSYITEERTKDKRLAVFDLGNNLEADKFGLKSQTYLEALDLLLPSSILFNHRELRHLESIRKFYQKKKRPFPSFVLSNGKSNLTKKELFLTNSHISDEFIVFGIVLNSKYTVPLKDYSFADIEKIKKKYGKNRKLILLFSGNNLDLLNITKLNIFDKIISSNSLPQTKKPTKEEKANPGILLREKSHVYMVPSFGQGILLGGNLRKKSQVLSVLNTKPKSNNCNLLDPSCSNPNNKIENISNILNENLFLWLTKKFHFSKPMLNLMDKYNSKTSSVFDKNAESRKKELANSQFVGSEACKSCHPNEYKVYQRSSHYNAYDTLVKKNKHKDKDCVSCHVLGFDKKGGFLNEELTPHFKNVQCENCHGPRKKHISNPLKYRSSNPLDSKKVCTSCHHIPHSSNFDFNEYWKKIFHEKK